ncbi:MAG: helix-turn-helix domain-containing protein [Muribaculaceae bacterium]|jgi:AraC family transcriptional regulator, transcriptional activator of pobA|nr:helix-turn-helix domain-containing protein [Muribaculaceae bacterium]
MVNDQFLPFSCIKLDANFLSQQMGNEDIQLSDTVGAFICEQGEIKVLIGAEIYNIHAGDICFYMPSTLVRRLYVSDDLKGEALASNLGFIIPIVNRVIGIENQLYLRQHPCITLDSDQFELITLLTRELRERLEKVDLAAMSDEKRVIVVELLKSYAQTICYETINMLITNQPLSPLPKDHNDIVFQKFLISLYNHYRKERTVTFYADELCISPKYFSTIIKEKSGMTVLQWIVSLVISDSKQMLEYSDASIKEIAADMNFPTQTFFGKYFKQYVGISPKEYRLRVKRHNINDAGINKKLIQKIQQL